MKPNVTYDGIRSFGPQGMLGEFCEVKKHACGEEWRQGDGSGVVAKIQAGNIVAWIKVRQ